LFVEGLRTETVSAGQIKDASVQFRGRAEQLAFFAFDRYAGVISDLCAQTGESVEKGGLAAIGIAGENYIGR
jgi:hypothetical protein